MKDKYFKDPEHNASFIRCIDVLAELIEKYVGKFVLKETGYEYWVNDWKIPIEITVSYDDHKDRCRTYQQYRGLAHNRRTVNCQKAS